MKHGYEKGKLNLPFVGIASFGKYPIVTEWGDVKADCAILGAPFDAGAQYRAGARFGPRAIREASTLFSFGHAGAYDHEDNKTYLDENVRIVDAGDADIIHTNTEQSHKNIKNDIQNILNNNIMPVTLGGDHSVTIPVIEAFGGQKPFHIIQIDAHLDFVNERHGVTRGHGNVMRRAAEKKYVTGFSQFGIRNVSSTNKQGYDDAKKMGGDILSVRQFREIGPKKAAKKIPKGRVYVTIDIDAFDPSIAAGTGTPSHGGFLYYEVLEFLAEIAKRNNVVGFDVVEVAPEYDHSQTTSILAAQIILNFIGRIFYK